MSGPRLLDLFCGQGGAAAGYARAGFEVFGIDIGPQPRYPFEFWQVDALMALEALVTYERPLVFGREWFGLADFDAIHASPPCQGYSIATAGNLAARGKHKRLIAATRELLALSGRPWVIENVEQARSQMVDPVLLCGRMFGLGATDEDGLPLVLDRHRLFESNVPLAAPEHPKHGNEQVAGVYGGSRRSSKPNATPADDRHAARHERHGGYVPRSKRVQQALLGIDWMTVRGMQESIPPAYAEHIGRQLLAALSERGAA
jgi:DNA (cytosine-5)-methyltransferase 1